MARHLFFAITVIDNGVSTGRSFRTVAHAAHPWCQIRRRAPFLTCCGRIFRHRQSSCGIRLASCLFHNWRIACDHAHWHLADMPVPPDDVCYRSRTDSGFCPVSPQLPHRELAAFGGTANRQSDILQPG
jgi:hypothetical protein